MDKNNEEDVKKLFQVPDFVGDSCKAIASRVRGAVASTTFDMFHRNSAKIIRAAVFGKDENQKIRNKFHFNANNLVITNIDIQSVEPVDQRTRDSLQKSVQLAIEITTKSQESTAKHENARLEQEALGRLERQKIEDSAEAEKSRKSLIELQTETAAVESTGQAKAEAKARSESSKIELEANVKQAKLLVEATNIKEDADLKNLIHKQTQELDYTAEEMNNLEIEKEKQLSEIEISKVKQVVNAIGTETLILMANAGPELQARLLNGLGLKSFLITDGNSPINLFNLGNGLLGEKK